MYIYCVVCYHVKSAPYVRSVDHVFAYLHTVDDDSECPMDYETTLIPNVFPHTHCQVSLKVCHIIQIDGLSHEEAEDDQRL